MKPLTLISVLPSPPQPANQSAICADATCGAKAVQQGAMESVLFHSLRAYPNEVRIQMASMSAIRYMVISCEEGLAKALELKVLATVCGAASKHRRNPIVVVCRAVPPPLPVPPLRRPRAHVPASQPARRARHMPPQIASPRFLIIGPLQTPMFFHFRPRRGPLPCRSLRLSSSLSCWTGPLRWTRCVRVTECQRRCVRVSISSPEVAG